MIEFLKIRAMQGKLKEEQLQTIIKNGYITEAQAEEILTIIRSEVN